MAGSSRQKDYGFSQSLNMSQLEERERWGLALVGRPLRDAHGAVTRVAECDSKVQKRRIHLWRVHGKSLLVAVSRGPVGRRRPRTTRSPPEMALGGSTTIFELLTTRASASRPSGRSHVRGLIDALFMVPTL